MVTFNYTVQDEIGLHARPAGMLAKVAKTYKSDILVEKNGRQVNATKLMMLMGLGIKHGDTVKVSVVGEDENEAAAAMQVFFENNL